MEPQPAVLLDTPPPHKANVPWLTTESGLGTTQISDTCFGLRNQAEAPFPRAYGKGHN